MSAKPQAKKRTEQTAVAVDDMPKGLEEGLKEVHLPKGWVLTSYGIPEKSASLRDRLRKVLKAHGLISIDVIPGSVYFGVREPELDKALEYIIKEIEKETGLKDLVKLLPGDFDEVTAAFLKNRIVANLLGDVEEAQGSIAELEKALAGEITLVDPKTKKPRDLLSLGESRIRNARHVIQEADSVTSRFGGSEALEAEAERIRLRMTQIRTWVDAVEKGYKRWAEVEKARVKAS
jgi:hypothetical protein